MRKQQERILNKAKEKARFLLAKVEREASQIIEGLKDVDAESQISIRDKAIESARAWLRKLMRNYRILRKHLLSIRNKTPRSP